MLIIDASVALKWVLEEEGSDRARAMILSDALAAPDLLWVECANVLWVKARRGQLAWLDAEAALAAIEATPVGTRPMKSLVASAQALAHALDHSVYDCLYLAAAIAERTTLITADEAFAKAVVTHGVHVANLRLL